MKYLLYLSLSLYGVSLLMICVSYGAGGVLTADYPGWMALIYGPLVFGQLQFAWIANPLYFISIVLSIQRVSKVTFGLSIAASLLTLNTFTWKYDIYAGAYVWMVSIFIFAVAQFLYLKKT